MGLVAFIADTAAGVLFAKGLNMVTSDNLNPMIGACGISAFPMSARVVHKLGLEGDPNNYLLMHAAGANVAGQLASIMAGGLILALMS
jgi:oxaloacetate decarboxylase beta subunit